MPSRFGGRLRTQQDDQAHLGDLTQTNRYTYTGDNPINNTDPTGRDWLGDVIGGVIAGVAIGLGVASGGIGFGLLAAGDLLGGAAGIAAAGPPIVAGTFIGYYSFTSL